MRGLSHSGTKMTENSNSVEEACITFTEAGIRNIETDVSKLFQINDSANTIH